MSKILIIDDDQNLCYMTKTALVQEGYEASASHTITKAVQEIKKNRPDLILMDIMLPEISGAEAVRMFKKDVDFKSIPIVFLTGLISSSEEDLEKKGITVDEVHYEALGKPYDMDDLLKLVKKNLGTL